MFEADISEIKLRMPAMEKKLISKVLFQCSEARRRKIKEKQTFSSKTMKCISFLAS